MASAAASSGAGKSRSKGFGKGPGTSFDASGASGTFVPATKAVMDAVPCLHGLSDGEQVAVVEAVEVIAQDPLRAEEATLLLQDACRAPSSLASAVTAVVGVLAVLREAVKRRTPFSRVQAAMEGANFPSTTSAALAAAAERSASAIAASALSDAPRLPGLSNLRWRVDVQIASSSAARVLRPCVVLEWTLSDGAVHTMTASTEQFHLLRHGVAKTLKGIIDDESHFVMRLSADMERAAARKQGK